MAPETAAPFGNLSGRRAVVTGSSSGIGRAIALEFARAGADLVVHARRAAIDAERLADEVRRLGRSATVLLADLGLAESLPTFVDDCWRALRSVDVWVNNAGADLLTGEDARRSFEEKLQVLLDVDVRSSVVLSKLAGERMAREAGGIILNIGWDHADRGMEGPSGELFAASKNAVMGFTRSLAVSLAPRVRVNCIAPGWIRTAWGETASEAWQERVRKDTPLGRWGTPEDVAKVARFLASSDAAYLTGQVIRINGGAVR
ncbi:MAG TPA: SDR family oxidoreductase [Planctomycetaceae bacterium]|nr:SDR family oxidoreductase [Planctomycetaceae bacterium]